MIDEILNQIQTMTPALILTLGPDNQTTVYHKNKVLWQIEKKNRGSFLDKIRK